MKNIDPFNPLFLIPFTFFLGVNLLIGTDNGLMLLDRSGQGKGKKCTNYMLFSRKGYLLLWYYKKNKD